MKLTIKARLLGAFTILIALSGFIYYLGSSSAAELNDQLNTIVEVNAKSISIAGKVAEDIQFITKREKDLILETETEDMLEYARIIEERNKELANRIDQLRILAGTDAAELEMIDGIAASWNDYFRIYNSKIKPAALKNTDSTIAVARKFSTNEGMQATGLAVDAANKVLKKNENDLAGFAAATDILYDNASRNMIILLVIAVIIAVSLSVWIISSITKSIQQATTAVKSVSEGDLSINIVITSRDEIGELLEHVKVMVEKLKDVVSSVTSSSSNIAAVSEQTSTSAQQLSQGTQEQAASAEQISSSMEQMVSNIQQNTDNAQQTEKMALKAAEDVQEGSKAVNQTVDSMKKIAEKISIISEIARQTNLLALNAAVEAARAGEHGKGFAVVAAEVRKLAERSQVAAGEINELSGSSVAIAEKSGKLLEQIVPSIQNTAKLVQEIAAASLEQNSGADQVNNAIQQFNQVIQQAAASAEEMASAAEELSGQAGNLQDVVAFFKVNGQHRISAVRTQKTGAFQKMKPNGPAVHQAFTKTNKGVVIELQGDKGKDTEYEKY
jgi:methyl-accepting chemotaxis protein